MKNMYEEIALATIHVCKEFYRLNLVKVKPAEDENDIVAEVCERDFMYLSALISVALGCKDGIVPMNGFSSQMLRCLEIDGVDQIEGSNIVILKKALDKAEFYLFDCAHDDEETTEEVRRVVDACGDVLDAIYFYELEYGCSKSEALKCIWSVVFAALSTGQGPGERAHDDCVNARRWSHRHMSSSMIFYARACAKYILKGVDL